MPLRRLRSPHRDPPVSLLCGALLGGLSALPFFLLEPARFPHPSASGWLVALLLALALAGGAGAATARLQSRLLRGALLLGAGPLLLHATLTWAVTRALTLHLWVKDVVVVSLAVGVGTLAVALVLTYARRRLATRWQRALAAALAWPLATVLALNLLERAAFPLTHAAPYLAPMALAVVHAYAKRGRWLLLAVALACLAAAVVVPGRYLGLHGYLLCVGGGAALCFARTLPTPHAAAGGARRIAATCAGLVVAFAGAHLLVRHVPSAYRLGQSSGGGLSAAMRAFELLTDVDGDGAGFVFTQRDCAYRDPDISPLAHEIPGNAVDENCLAGPAAGTTPEAYRARFPVHAPPPRHEGDIVLILVDTLRADEAWASQAGGFAGLRARGLTYTQAYTTAPFTASALMTILGGRLPTAIPLHFEKRLSAVPTHPPEGLAPRLKRAGYATIAAVAMRDNGYYARATYGEGFDVRVETAIHAPPDEITDAAIAAFDDAAGTPRFLLVHHLWAHGEFRGDREQYVTRVHEVDREVARLLAHVGPGALVVLVADHGEEFGEHGGTAHARTLFHEVMHVPLVVAYPGHPPGEVDAVTSLVTLAPTLLSSVAPEASAGPYLCTTPTGPDACRDGPAPMALELEDAHLHGLRLGSDVLVRDVDRQTLAFYDLARDPGQHAPSAQVPHALEARLVDWEENLFAPLPAGFFWP